MKRQKLKAGDRMFHRKTGRRGTILQISGDWIYLDYGNDDTEWLRKEELVHLPS